jgi:hypothetical protein
MKNTTRWRSGDPDIPAADLDRIASPLEALEAVFRPLVQDLPPDLEPSLTFSAEKEGE